jgi:hypothetical protein
MYQQTDEAKFLAQQESLTKARYQIAIEAEKDE